MKFFIPGDFCSCHNATSIAEKANMILEQRGTVVYCRKLGESNLTDQHGPGWIAGEPSTRNFAPLSSTHSALLISIQPIKAKEDTEISLLRELSNVFVFDAGNLNLLKNIAERTRKLLSKTQEPE